MSDADEEAFMAAMKVLFEEGRYNEIIDTWGADTSRSHEFKTSAFDDYEATDGDVIVSTYAKSGTTWSMQIAYQAGFLGEGEFEHIDNVVSWPDKLIPLPDNPALDDRSHLSESPTRLHVVKSHLETAYVPLDSDAKFISVIRDPKDVIVSAFHFENGFNQMLFDDIVPLDTWVDTFMTDRFIYQSWPEFIDSWWQVRDRDNVLVLLYEDMRADSEGAVRQIVDFLGIELDESQFANVVERSGFAYMKANAQKFDPPAWDGGQVSLVRDGKTGSAKHGMTADQRTRIDAWCLAKLEQLGSDFPYERYRSETDSHDE